MKLPEGIKVDPEIMMGSPALQDLRQSAAQAKDADTRASLEAVCERLAALL
jgi:hypothetical protein